MDQNKNTEKNNEEKKEKSTHFAIKISLVFTILTLIIFYGIMKVSTERDKYKETIINLKFERDSAGRKVIRLMSKIVQINQNQRVAELEAKLRSEQNWANNKVKQLKSQLAELETRINKKSVVELSQSKPALANWIFENSSNTSKKIAGEIVDCVLETNFPLFLLALIKTESTFDPTSISKKGALGLGQVMPRDYKEKLKEAGIITEMRDVFNIPVGVKSTEFAWNDKLTEAKGDILKALALYLGEKNNGYNNQILKDFLYLNYLCKKPKASFGLSQTLLETNNRPEEETNNAGGS